MKKQTTVRIPPQGSLMIVGYTNYRGEYANRRVAIESRVYWGSTEYYPEPQWLIDVHDYDRKAGRTLALAKMRPHNLEHGAEQVQETIGKDHAW